MKLIVRRVVPFIWTRICLSALLSTVMFAPSRAAHAQGSTLAAPACRNPVTQFDANKLPTVRTNEAFACLSEIATKFQQIGQSVTHEFVPADPGCSSDAVGHPDATQITVTVYDKAGNLDYESDFQRRDGFVLARIENKTRCQTRGIVLKPNHTYFWVVENQGKSARLVSADDIVRLKEFTSCKNQGAPDASQSRQSVAMIKLKDADPKRGQCDHKRTPDRGRLGALPGSPRGADGSAISFASNRTNRRSAQRGSPEWVVWITCAQDCCYAD